MKPNLSPPAERSRFKSLLLLVGLILSPCLLLGQVDTTNFYGTVGNPPPQVDAIHFNNYATWAISTTPLPYQTAHTLYYTNEGNMYGSLGWEFDYGPSVGGSPSSRGMSASFFNDNSAIIQAADGTFNNPPTSPFSTTASYVLVSATNIVNKGTLMAGPNGEIVLNGDYVSLARSELEITPILGLSSGSSNGTNTFVPDTGIYDELWSTNTLTVNGQVWNGISVAQLTYHGAGEPCGVTNVSGTVAGITPQIADSYVSNLFPYQITLTNSSGSPGQTVTLYSNVIKQASFVATSDPNITASNHFSPPLNLTNNFKTVVVRFAVVTTNVITLAKQTQYLYVVDDLASLTNLTLLTNSFVNTMSSCTAPSFRPSSVIVSRSDPTLPGVGPAFGSGSPGLGTPAPGFFTDLVFDGATIFPSNSVAVGIGDIYSAYVDYLPSPIPTTGEGDNISNVAGRITITANNLDLSRTRMSAESLITIIATNLIGSQDAAIDCPNFSYHLGSTTGFINVTNLVVPTIGRFNGTITEWSGLWTNFMDVVFPDNYAPVIVGSTTNWVPSPLTNIVEVDAAVTVMDGTGLSSTVPTTVQDLVLNSTNMVISDNMTNVVGNLLFNGSSLTINGALYLSGNLQNWNSAIAPTLQDFTNNGFLIIPNVADFGGDTVSPYAEFVNSSYIYANSQIIHSRDIQITGGINFTSGDFSAVAQTMEITGPTIYPTGIYANSIYAGGSINLYADTLQLNQAELSAGNQINFYVTNALSDNGSPCSLTCYNGFNLRILPQTGDLLGTTVTSIASGNNTAVDSVWAGEDRGPNLAGYTNNAAIGTLKLIAQNYVYPYTPLFEFTGATGSNAMYVGTLDLSQVATNAAELASMIQIDPGMKIYAQHVILGFNPPGNQSPEEYLQSQFPGQFGTAPDFVTAAPSAVTMNATTANVFQRIDGFGASSAWRSTWNSTQADLFFSTNNNIVYTDNLGNTSTNNGIGLSLLRNHIYPAGFPTTTTSSAGVPYTTETSIMLMAQAYGAKVWSTPWTPPAGFKSTNDIYGSGVATGGGINGGSFIAASANYQAYADQLANYVLSMKNLGINLYAISVQNEPDANVTSYEACQWSPLEISDFVPYLYNALAANGVGSTKIMLPESQNWPDYHGFASTVMSTSDSNLVQIIADHNYDGLNGPASLVKNNYGKALWETEVATFDAFNGSIDNGIYWAGRIYLFLTQAQVNAYNYWWLISANPDNEGLMSDNGVLTKRMFVFGQFSRFIRPGYNRIGVTNSASNLLVSAYENTNTLNFAMVVINTNQTVSITQPFNVAGITVSSVTPWITSSSLSLAPQAPVAVTRGSFTYTIPALSVVTFVGQGSGVISSNIVISSTAYLPGGHSFVLTWNSIPGATYSVHKGSVLSSSSTNWPAIITGYPPGGAVGGTLSYTDTTVNVGPAFYRVSNP